MILMYEDEAYFIEEYIEAIQNSGFEVRIFQEAEEFFKFAEEHYLEIQLYLIDLMVFGPGNEFDGRNTDGGAQSGILLLDEIGKLEKKFPNVPAKKKIILTNRKGPVFEKAKRDQRVDQAIHKSDVLPSEFAKIVKKAI